jgi:hypothetical protein
MHQQVGSKNYAPRNPDSGIGATLKNILEI